MTKYFHPTQMLKEAKQTGKGHRWGIEILIFLLVFFIGQTLVSIPVTVATLISVFTSESVIEALTTAMQTGNVEDYMEQVSIAMNNLPDWTMLVQLFSTALATLVAILFCKWIEKRSPASMGLRRGHFWREYGLGSLFGILLISACVGICVLCGSLTLAPSAFSPVMWVLFLMGFVVQGMSEEVVCRGYMMVSVSRKNSMLLAVLTNSVMFALLHIFNPGFGILPLINIALFGILESVYVLKRGDLWGACAIHSLWNFFQGNVFGISVSGTGAGASPLSATVKEGMAWLNGGTFGIEGGIAVTVVTALAILGIIFLLPANREELAKEEPIPTIE